MRRELVAALILAACNSAGSSTAVEGAGGSKSAAAPFRIEVAPPASCVAGQSCEARIELTALGAYKVNEEYPFKFVADPGLGVEVDAGDFEITGKKSGTMTVRLRPAEAGQERVSGIFKLSVCTPDNCKIEEPKVAFDLRVTPSS